MRIVTCLLLLATSCASAQSVVNADSVGLQPQISRDEKGFNHCGIRAVAVVGVGKTGHAYDFSINVYPDAWRGLIKAGKYTNISMLDASKMPLKPIAPAPIRFWFAAADQGVPMVPTKLFPGDTEGFILGSVTIEQAMEAVLDMAYGKQVQFAVRYKNQPLDEVVSFASTLSKTDNDALMACIQGIYSRMRAAVADEKAHKEK